MEAGGKVGLNVLFHAMRSQASRLLSSVGDGPAPTLASLLRDIVCAVCSGNDRNDFPATAVAVTEMVTGRF